MSSDVTPPAAWEAKADHRLRALVARAAAGLEDPGRVVRLLLQFRGSVEALREHGATVCAVAGDIATAEVALPDIARLASRSEILFLELGHTLGPDPAPPIADSPPTEPPAS